MGLSVFAVDEISGKKVCMNFKSDIIFIMKTNNSVYGFTDGLRKANKLNTTAINNNMPKTPIPREFP